MRDWAVLACLDVDYRDDGTAIAACLVFENWTDATPANEHLAHIASVAPYEPGEFWRRELPCLMEFLYLTDRRFAAILLDGYVVLDGSSRPGLGMKLFDALGGTIPVVGVAKSRFAGATAALALLRGKSASPLWITSVGMDVRVATDHVRSMHGAHRMPTLLRLVDRKARDGVAPSREAL